MWGFLTGLLKFLWPVLVELLPLVVKALAGDKDAKGRARAIQKETEKEIALIRKGKEGEDEISRREAVRLATLEWLFRERRLRLRKPSDQ